MKIPTKAYVVIGLLLLLGGVPVAYRMGVNAGQSKAKIVKVPASDMTKDKPPTEEPATSDLALPEAVPAPVPTNPWQVLTNVPPQDQNIDKSYTGYHWRNQILETGNSTAAMDVWCVFEYPGKRIETKLLGRFNIIGKITPEATLTSDACARLR